LEFSLQNLIKKQVRVANRVDEILNSTFHINFHFHQLDLPLNLIIYQAFSFHGWLSVFGRLPKMGMKELIRDGFGDLRSIVKQKISNCLH
jgi:hypothetical protein